MVTEGEAAPMKGTTVFLVAALLSPVFAAAHEGGLDARGTVKEIGPDRLVLATADGAVRTFSIGEDTRFARGRAPVRVGDVRVGERVVVHARREGKQAHATNVRLAPRLPGG